MVGRTLSSNVMTKCTNIIIHMITLHAHCWFGLLVIRISHWPRSINDIVNVVQLIFRNSTSRCDQKHFFVRLIELKWGSKIFFQKKGKIITFYIQMVFSLHLKTTMKFDTLTIYHIKYINYYVQSCRFKNILSSYF